MKFIANSYIVIFILFILSACEEGAAIKKADTYLENLKVKTFVAKSSNKIYTNNRLQNAYGKTIVGRKTIKDESGNSLYIMRVRPIYRFTLDSGSVFRFKDSNGNLTNNLKIYGQHKFKFRGDSLNSNRNFYNAGFNQKVNLKAFVESITDSTMFHKSNNIWTHSRYGRFEDLLNTKVIKMGASETITNSVDSIRPIKEIPIENNDLSKIFKRSTINGFNIFPINSFVLDYSDEIDGLFTIDSLPQLLINVYNDTIGKPSDTLTITASSMYSWITYEKIGNSADTYHVLRNADREALKINFESDSINNFISKNKIYTAKFEYKYINPVDLPLSTLTSTAMREIKEKDISTFNDGLPEFDLSIFALSGLSISKTSDKKVGNIASSINSERIFTYYIRNWFYKIGIPGSIYLLPSLGAEPAVTIFNKNLVNDSTFILKLYYSDIESNGDLK